MANKKRRSYTQIMEEKSYTVIRDLLPSEWVFHQYSPDYGIDLVVETFKYISENNIAETLGEQFFVQLKSVSKIKTIKKRVYGRMNVEISTAINYNESIDLNVISYTIKTSELLTVESMGSATPVMLFLVDLSTKKSYFLCLNDYIEKVLLLDDPDYDKKDTKTIYIPLDNEINSQNVAYLMFYARRAKYYAAFNKFNYQYRALFYEKKYTMIERFLNIIKKYDFWLSEPIWPALIDCYEDIKYLEKFFSLKKEERISTIIENYKVDFNIYDLEEYIHEIIILPIWRKLSNLGRIYEDVCKQWLMPTYFWKDYS